MTGMVMLTKGGVCGSGGGKESRRAAAEEQQNQLSLVALLLAALRKSMVSCRVLDQGGGEDQLSSRSSPSSSAALHHMEIGWPTNVQHLTHVTFDRFRGFLGLPVEFQVEIPCRVPSASISVFGVSAESMQCSYDSRGNSVPTILLLMQERLYTQGGLKAEGIFRINPENSKEEHVRDQLNRGTVPCNIDVHCLAGLIKAWFRELPTGVLDGLSPEEVLQCNTEEESVELVKQLQPTETELLNWAIDLMADVVEQEESNKMNARNIAMVFAPNMTQMSDPLTALMHAVQVMNLLKTLIMKTLREREETTTGGYSPMSSCSSDRQTVEEVDSQQEMNISCELRRLPSDHDEQVDFNTSSESEDEVESLGGIEECFLEHLDENENAKNNIREELEGDSQIELAPSPGSGSTLNRESAVSLCDGRISSSRLSTSDGEDSGLSSIETEFKVDAKSSSKLSEITSDVCMVEKLVNPGFPVPLCVSSRYA